MHRFIIAALPLLVVFAHLFGQRQVYVRGTVFDEQRKPLPGCHVHYGNLCSVTDNLGKFEIAFTERDKIKLEFTFVGYRGMDTLIELSVSKEVAITLYPDFFSLDEAQVRHHSAGSRKSDGSETVSSEYLARNYSTSLPQTISRLPGISSVDIGYGTSKPVIRGMGFNRVVVAENRIRHEGQQWGEEHGLEVDPLSVEATEVVKGASTTDYGGDALGGYIHIINNRVPEPKSLSGNVTLTGQSINQGLGSSALIQGRSGKLFFKLRASGQVFGDYRIPTDTIIYLARKVPVFDRRLKNTAGHAMHFHSQWGVISRKVKSTITLSRNFKRSGFFPGTHGVPDLSRVNRDGDRLDIGYPYHRASHIKAISNTIWQFPTMLFYLDLAWQHNRQEEISLFHTHYPGQLPPVEDPNLEKYYGLSTYDVNASIKIKPAASHEATIGMQNQYLVNLSSGYNFYLPAYYRFNSALFFTDEWRLSDKQFLNISARFDYGTILTEPRFDSVLFSYLQSRPDIEGQQAVDFSRRSQGLNRNFRGITWRIGLYNQFGDAWVTKANVGSFFRIPSVPELAAHGTHHGSLRFETGNPDISPETGYYGDLYLEFKARALRFSIGTYLYFFQNLIYLKPELNLNTPLPHSGGMHLYTASQALLNGVEVSVKYDFTAKFRINSNIELPRNYLLTSGNRLSYGLPYSPPVNGMLEAEYDAGPFVKFNACSQYSLAMDRLRGQGEEYTPGWVTLGVGSVLRIKTRKHYILLVIKADNLLNRKYFNHMSYYRRFEIPEQGRNIRFICQFPFQLK